MSYLILPYLIILFQRGEMLLAMEDYAQATKLCPTRTDALYKHAMHYFNNQ